MIPVAHAGHWALGALYLAPVIVVVFIIGRNAIADRRAKRQETGKRSSAAK